MPHSDSYDAEEGATLQQHLTDDGERKPAPLTMKALAESLGLHTSTVSRALDPRRSHLVSDATRLQVIRAAAEASYRPDPTAAGLRRRETKTIGVLVPDLGNPTIVQTVRALTAVLDQADQLPLIAESMDDPARTESVIERFLARRSDAIVTLAATEGDRTALEAASRDVPVVLAVRSLRGTQLPTVRCDDLYGGSLAADHLVDLGHRCVAQLRGPATSRVFEERASGFEMVAQQRGLEVINLPAAAHATVLEGYQLASELVDSSDALPTAIFAHNDSLAVGAHTALSDRGIRCPEQMSIVGFNAARSPASFAVSLTSVAYPSERVGRRAGEMVLSLLRRETLGVSPSVFRPELQLGQSSGPPPGR